MDHQSTTPEGSPGPGYINPLKPNAQQQQQQQAGASTTPAPDTSSILKALADMAKQNTSQQQAPSAATPAPPAPTTIAQTPSMSSAAPVTAAAASNPLASLLGQAAVQQPQAAPQIPQPTGTPVNLPSMLNPATSAAPAAGAYPAGLSALAGLTGGFGAQNPAAPAPAATPAVNPLSALFGQTQAPNAAATPTIPPAAPALGSDPLQQLNLIQLLAAQGIPQDQWATALQTISLLSSASNAGLGGLNPATMTAAMAALGQQPAATGTPTWPAATGSVDPRDRHDHPRDRERDFAHGRSPPHRRRSRSPLGWDRRRELSPPRRRESPVYGDYRSDSPAARRGGMGRGRGYRERSPGRGRRRSPSPPRKDTSLPPPGPKFLEYDNTLPNGCIKVLSRTLFVGGVT
ncbi:hypothetical protein KEM55_004096 [Ascosphaera atra]|nr:hypothetical protein KEM55_004096 [Ascosphaera atra]